MEFEDRLKKAISRGHDRSQSVEEQKRAASLSLEELKGRHSQIRLQLSEHIETVVEKLMNHFPGFRYETIFGERGWGAACWRDDVGAGAKGRRADFYSRFEMTIRPHTEYNVIDLNAKGTIRNKEVYNRNHFEEIEKVDVSGFVELIDQWAIEYAELFAAS